MPVHHRLRFLTFPMRTSRLCSLWPDMRPLRFRRVPFGRDVAFDPGGATASRIAMPHMLPSTVPSVSASAKLLLSWLNPPPHPITVYASHPPSPTGADDLVLELVVGVSSGVGIRPLGDDRNNRQPAAHETVEKATTINAGKRVRIYSHALRLRVAVDVEAANRSIEFEKIGR